MENYGEGMGGGGVDKWGCCKMILIYLFVVSFCNGVHVEHGWGQVRLKSTIGVSLLVVYEVQYD